MAYFMHLFFYSQWEMAFWWGFALQYIAIFLASVFHLIIGLPNTQDTPPEFISELALGGGGIRDALWTAPSTTILACYLAYNI